MLTPISHFRNRHRGESVAILANGASLKEYAVRGGMEFCSIGINKTWQLYHSTYHCIIDIRQLEDIVSTPRPIRRRIAKDPMRPEDWGRDFRHLFVGGNSAENLAEKRKVWSKLNCETVTEIRGTLSRYGLRFDFDLDGNHPISFPNCKLSTL